MYFLVRISFCNTISTNDNAKKVCNEKLRKEKHVFQSVPRRMIKCKCVSIMLTKLNSLSLFASLMISIYCEKKKEFLLLVTNLLLKFSLQYECLMQFIFIITMKVNYI